MGVFHEYLLVTLNEGYLRAAKRQQKLIQIFNQNLTYQPSMKRRFLLVCLYCFLRLQIYEAIAAIFWQYSSYVY